MKKIAFLAAVAAFTMTPAAAFADDAAPAQVEIVAGKSLYGSDGKKVATIYRVTDDGTPQVILNGKLVNVPASSVSEADGKLTTTFTKKELTRRR